MFPELRFVFLINTIYMLLFYKSVSHIFIPGWQHRDITNSSSVHCRLKALASFYRLCERKRQLEKARLRVEGQSAGTGVASTLSPVDDQRRQRRIDRGAALPRLETSTFVHTLQSRETDYNLQTVIFLQRFFVNFSES